MRRFRHLFPDSSIAGQSMRAGGATALAEDGAPPHIIQAAGRWPSDTFQIYIRNHPVLGSRKRKVAFVVWLLLNPLYWLNGTVGAGVSSQIFWHFGRFMVWTSVLALLFGAPLFERCLNSV
jgi:hypothetical protein